MGGGLVCRVQSSPSLGCAALRRFATCAKPTLLFAAVWLRYGVASPHWKTVRVRFCGSWVAFQVPNPSSRAAKRVVACCMSLSTYDSCLGLDISCESSVPRSLAVLVVWRWPETLLMTLAAGFRCNFYSHFFPSATLLSACLHGVDPARCRRHVAWRSPCLLACRPGGWEARHCGPRFCSRFLLLSGAAARQAERTLEYDLEGRLLHLSHAEARVGCGRRPPRAHPVAFSSHGLPRAPRALDRCSAGQSSTSVSRKLQPGTAKAAKVSFLVTVIQNPTPAPVPEPIRLAPARSARGLFPPPVLLPSDLLQLWAEAACSKFVHASAAAAAAAVLKVCRLHGF